MTDLAAAAPYRPIKKRTVSEEVCAQIRGRIYEELLKPGEKLPPERELAQQLGVGRAAVREALQALDVAGVIRFRKGVNGGAFVQQLTPDIMSTSMRDMVLMGKIPLEDLIETRLLMNDIVIPLVCQRATDLDLHALEENAVACVSSTGLSERIANTRQFYQLLGLASRNQLVMSLLGSLTEIVLDFAEKARPQPLARVPEVRLRLVAALKQRNVATALTASRELTELMHHTLEHPKT